MERYTLKMTFEGPYGNTIHQYCLDISPCVARDFERISVPVPELTSFETVVDVLKTRVLRKDMFMDASKRLGGLLAEAMEDKEGWHGASRQAAYESTVAITGENDK